MDVVSDELRTIMRARRHLAPDAADTFTIDTSATFQNLLGKILNSFGAVVAAIAGISLVVGGIVIMNIMLVSVTERTREIGVRKALGARRNDILLQFLIESATMSLVGGVIGVIAGIGVAKGDYPDHRVSFGGRGLVDPGQLVRGHRRGPVLRSLSGIQGRATRSHRRPAERSYSHAPQRLKRIRSAGARYSAQKQAALRPHHPRHLHRHLHGDPDLLGHQRAQHQHRSVCPLPGHQRPVDLPV